MNKIDNMQGVKKIKMYPTACVKCALGQDWYKINFEVTFVPEGNYPDYTEVQEAIMRDIDGKELNIEDAGENLFIFLSQYSPKSLEVVCHVKGCKTHFDVDVFIE